MDEEQKKAWLQKLQNYRRNLLFIEEQIGHYVDFTAIPLQLVRRKWWIEQEIAKLENNLGLSHRGGGP